MAWFRSNKKGIGANVIPTFTEIVLVDNSTLASSFTYSEDYRNYDFLRFKLHNSSSSVDTYILTTPSTIDAIFNVTSRIMLNEYSNNQGCTYSQSGLTWTRQWQRNVDIYEVVGLTCTNVTMTETEIFKATSQSGTSIDITTQLDLMSFDWILFSSNDSTYDEIMLCQKIFTPSESLYRATNEQPIPYAFSSYSSSTWVNISRNYISASTYLYVVGINFTKR